MKKFNTFPKKSADKAKIIFTSLTPRVTLSVIRGVFICALVNYPRASS